MATVGGCQMSRFSCFQAEGRVAPSCPLVVKSGCVSGSGQCVVSRSHTGRPEQLIASVRPFRALFPSSMTVSQTSAVWSAWSQYEDDRGQSLGYL